MGGRRAIARGKDAAAYAHAETIRSTGRLIAWVRRAPRERPDDEYIHELRVRLRRARAAMRAFRRFYPSRREYERRVAPLRKLTRRLGPLRDADVTADLLRDALRDAPLAPRAVRRHLAHHDAARSARWRALRPALRDLGKLNATALAPQRARARALAEAARPLAKHAHRVLTDRFDRVWALRGAPRRGNPADLHALRIEIKRLRYSMEAFDALLGRAGRAWRERLREMQAALGVINDHTVAIDLLQRFAAREREALQRTALAHMAATLATRREELIVRFRKDWRNTRLKRLRALFRGAAMSSGGQAYVRRARSSRGGRGHA